MKLTPILAAVAAVAFSTQGQALTTSVTSGPLSAEAGAVTDTFDVGSALTLNRSGGALFDADIGGVTARPPGSTGNFWSIGTSGNQSGPGVIDLSAGPASYYGFLWGSPDTYNTVSFYDGEVLLGSFTGSVVLNPANGDQSVGKFFNAFAGAGELITRVEFLSGGNAFETDNHALVSAPVPEPGTYALLLAGLAAIGSVVRRRTARG